MKDRRCGRLGDHMSHRWTAQIPLDPYGGAETETVEYWCDGKIVIEGGHRGVM